MSEGSRFCIRFASLTLSSKAGRASAAVQAATLILYRTRDAAPITTCLPLRRAKEQEIWRRGDQLRGHEKNGVVEETIVIDFQSSYVARQQTIRCAAPAMHAPETGPPAQVVREVDGKSLPFRWLPAC